jgi:hypothetical protein
LAAYRKTARHSWGRAGRLGGATVACPDLEISLEERFNDAGLAVNSTSLGLHATDALPTESPPLLATRGRTTSLNRLRRRLAKKMPVSSFTASGPVSA